MINPIKTFLENPKEIFVIIGQLADDGSVVATVLPRVQLESYHFGDLESGTLSLQGRILTVEGKNHRGIVHCGQEVGEALRKVALYFED